MRAQSWKRARTVKAVMLTGKCTELAAAAAAFCEHPSFGSRGFAVAFFTSDNPIAPRDWRKTLQAGGWLGRGTRDCFDGWWLCFIERGKSIG